MDFNKTAPEDILPEDMDIIVEDRKKQAFILHTKPFRHQTQLKGIRYDAQTHLFTVIADGGKEQILDKVALIEPLRRAIRKVETVTTMLVNNEGQVFSVNTLPLLIINA